MYDGGEVVGFVTDVIVILSLSSSSVYFKTFIFYESFYQYLHVVTNQ